MAPKRARPAPEAAEVHVRGVPTKFQVTREYRKDGVTKLKNPITVTSWRPNLQQPKIQGSWLNCVLMSSRCLM